MPRTIIRNATIILPDGLEKDRTVTLEDGKIADIRPSQAPEPSAAEQTVDAGGDYLAPGFIDLHTHGVHELLINNGPDHLAGMCRILPRYGVTAFLPTVCSLPKGKDAELVGSLATVQSEGTEILGFHLEGPFLVLTGALPPETIGAADPDRVRSLIEAASPYRAIFSIAPDFEGIMDLIPIMAEGGGVVFVTHTAANVAQSQTAIDAGAHHATHFYNVFPFPDETELGARPCGAVEAMLADPRCTVDFILDGAHVDPVAVKMALQCKGPGGVCLITDSNVGAGLPPGKYGVGEGEVEFAYPGAPARMTEKTRLPGAISGSGLTMIQAVRNAVKMLDVDVPQAIRMGSTNPAAVLGLDKTKGKIAPGFDADVVLLDNQLQVKQTWVGGKCCFKREPQFK